MMNALPYLKETVSQTAGPFLHIGLMPALAGLEDAPPAIGRAIAGPDCAGERVAVSGRVFDGFGAVLKDMLIEVWQADANGIYASVNDPRHGDVAKDFRGFGRIHTDLADGTFRIETVKPGRVPGRHGRFQAPHLNLWLVARGVNIGLSTRLYFGDEEEANGDDPLLGMIDPPHRRRSLIAERSGDRAYTFDIHLQGDDETVFLDV